MSIFLWTHEEFIDEKNHADAGSYMKQRRTNAPVEALNAFRLENSPQAGDICQLSGLLARAQVLAWVCDQSGCQFGQDATAQTFKVALKSDYRVMAPRQLLRNSYRFFAGRNPLF